MFAYYALLFVLASLTLGQRPNPLFSGVYLPNLKLNMEDYTASCLISKARFLDSRRAILEANVNDGGEPVTESLIRRHGCPRCKQVMTRDFLDLMVEHMSSTSNQLLWEENSDKAKKFMKNLKKSMYKLRDAPPTRSKETRLQKTIALISCSSSAVAVPSSLFQMKARKYFFLSTFWSVHRYISNIVVYTESELDYHSIRNMTLPYFDLIRIPPVNGTNFNLLKQAVLQTMDKLETPPSEVWKKFKYVYFSEGDQILHMRSHADLYDVVDFNRGYTALLPHRMHTIPPPTALPWHVNSTPAEQAVQMDILLTVENITESSGRCCDNGRYKFASCSDLEGWMWYWCPRWGLLSLHYWMQFDKTGLVMPLATEHQASCLYTAQRKVCPVPADCQYRTLPRLGTTTGDHPEGDPAGQREYFCQEMPVVQYVGDFGNQTLPMRRRLLRSQ